MTSPDIAAPFSLLAPLTAARRLLRTNPEIVPLVALLAAAVLVPVAAGVQWVLRDGGYAALESWIAGAPAGTKEALLATPDAAGIRQLILAGLLITLGAALLAAAGTTTVRATRTGLRAAITHAPVFSVGFIVHALLAAGLVTATLLLASLAGDLRFQLFDVVTVLGLIFSFAVLARLSLWPAVTATAERGVFASMRASWRLTRQQNVRVAFSAVGVILATAGPALIAAFVIRTVLTALERGEIIAWAPVVIDAVALAPFAFAALAAALIWAAGIGDMQHALAEADRIRRLRALEGAAEADAAAARA